jgi:hypothetical protein
MFIDALLFVAWLLQCYAVTAISVILFVAVQTAYTIFKEKV